MAFIVFTIIMITYIHAVKNYPNNRTVHYGYTAAFILCYITSYHRCIIYYDNVNLIIALFHALFITLFIWYDNILYHANVTISKK